MADFCQQCCKYLFGKDTKDVAGLCKEGEMAAVLCEGCGKNIFVDHAGKRIDSENWNVDVIHGD